MFASLLLAYIGCETPKMGESGVQLPDFVDDCGSWQNETLETASGLWPEDGVRIQAELCNGERDVYALVIPAGAWVSLTLEMSGTGEGDTDLDLWEVATAEPPEGPEAPETASDDRGRDFAVASYSATEKPFEWLAWYNADLDAPVVKYVVVDGWGGASDRYELVFQVLESAEVLDCEDYDETRESGPCDSPPVTDSNGPPSNVEALAQNTDVEPPETLESSEKLLEFLDSTTEENGPTGWPPTSFAEDRAEAAAQDTSLEIPIDDQTASFMTKLTQVGLAGISLLLGLVAVEHVQGNTGRRLRRPKASPQPPKA